MGDGEAVATWTYTFKGQSQRPTLRHLEATTRRRVDKKLKCLLA